ncbi:unnamed protein product [Adineta steineri]|uniref:Uncharacterized protein n=1 Tax=Adineta steineri TaxID=433720 RepID=A0A819GXU7_9BILA|nr:unnamed protein product [Adineta steineri]
MAWNNMKSIEEVITCVKCLKHFDDPLASANNGSFECPMRDGIQIESQILTTLSLFKIYMSNEGAKHLANALQHNKAI